MPSPFPLKPLLDLTQTKLDDATKRLGELVARENEQSQKLQVLQDYRNEYFQRFEAALQNGITPEMWRNYTAFIGRIDEAIEAQRGVLERAHKNTETGKQEWVGHRNRLKAYTTLEARHRQKEYRLDQRREQKQLDEHTATLFRKKREAAAEEDPEPPHS